MKKLLLFAIVICTCLISCSKEDIYSTRIIGKWDVVKTYMRIDGKDTETDLKEADYGYQFVFSKDGIMKFIIKKYDGETNEGEYTYSIVSTSAGPKLEWAGNLFTIYTLSTKELVFGSETMKYYCEKH